MNALQAIINQLNVAYTENGDLALKSSSSACLDLFSLCGGMRKNPSSLDKLFALAYAENSVVAIKILFYMRNIRGGLGERESFRSLLKELGMNAAEYRKLCSKLRKEIKILEDNLRRKDYTFDYSKQPSQAMLKYKKAFLRNDSERYKSFLNKVVEQTEKIARGEKIPEEEKVKLNTKTLYPYQIVAPFMNCCYFDDESRISEEETLSLEASWKSLNRKQFDSKTIVVRDGSGSMYSFENDSPINIATSFALLFAEQLSGVYKNSFITFSQNPELVQIPENADTLKKKLNFTRKFNEIANTDIAKVYQLILDVAKNTNVPKEEMIERVLIISDMEFDSCVAGVSTFDFYKQKFEEAGYELPELVFWNVAARNVHLPVTMNEKGVKLVSGASANIFSDVVSGELKVVTPYEFMLKMLEPYSEFDKIAA